MGGTPISRGGSTDIPALVEPLTRQFTNLDTGVLGRYLSEIVAWNEQIGLVSKSATAAALERLVRQSAQLYEFIDGCGVFDYDGRPRIVDIGAGGGFPGIIWKITRPDVELVLVERRSKKAAFLERTVVILGLDDVEVVEKDSTEVMTFKRFSGRFDLAVAMAVGPPLKVARGTEGFLRSQGYFCTVRPRREKNQPEKVGKQLKLKSTAAKNQSLFCLYQLEE